MKQRKAVTLFVEPKLYEKFRKLCQQKGWIVSRQFEKRMENVLINENQKVN